MLIKGTQKYLLSYDLDPHWSLPQWVCHVCPICFVPYPSIYVQHLCWDCAEQGHSTHAEVMARYLSWPAVSQIWAFIVFPSTWMLLVANSTPMVLLLSRLNSLRVKRDRRLLFPTPESPINTTEKRDIIFTINFSYQHWSHTAVQHGR